MTTRNKRKLAALNKEYYEEHPNSNLVQNSNVPGSQEDYITQVSEEIEGRLTKRFSEEFSRTKNGILGALARLNDFLLNPLLQGYSGTTTSNVIFFHKHWFDFFHQGCNRKVSVFGEYWARNYQFFSCDGILIVQTFRKCFHYGLI